MQPRPVRWFRSLLLPSSLILVLAACATNPVTGRRELSLMSASQELQLGAESDEAIVAQYGLVDDPALVAYVEGVGEKLVPVSHRPDLDFHFRVLDDPIVNAFALPGGYVYITRGILAYLNSEAALAGVMGHEIGHVTARHSAQRYTQQVLLGTGLALGSVFSQTFARYADLAGSAGQLLLLKYGRDDERQSDELGVQYATAVGYDTNDMAEFFRSLERLTPADGRLPGWMSTHPDPGERWNTVHALTREQQEAGTQYELDRERYLEHIDGLVFGADPREGFFRDGLFHHPQLRFRFPVPAGWKTQNGKSQVVMVEPGQAGAVIFMAAKGSTPSAAADAFLQQNGVKLLERRNVIVAGGGGVRTLARIEQAQGSQIVLSTFFTHGTGQWVFHGLTTDAAYRKLRDTLLLPAEGFAEETDPEVLGVKPYRLKVVTAPRSGSFRSVASSFALVPGSGIEDLESLAVLNGRGLDDPIREGESLKVVAQP